MTTATPTFVLDAVRTPVGRIGGALAAVRPDDLAAGTVRALLDRWPALDPATIDEVYVGDANQAGEDNRNVGRMACLLAGLPTSVPGATVNRLCGSGLDAIACASRAVAVGDADVALAGGVESMSRAPWVLQKPAKGYPTGHEQLWSTTLGWRMTNPAMPKEWTVALGEGAELLADRHSIGRDEQDEFALRSHQQADAAWTSGWFDAEVVPVAAAALDRDECIRADTTLAKLASLKPVFRPDGTVTAGNSSPMNDGASMLLLASETGLARIGAEPLARIVSRASSGVEPHLYGIGPVESVRVALKRAGITWSDLDAVELNEAFAAQSLACLREMPELDPSIVNAQGGAIALGHALGGSGARIVTTLVHRLRRTGGRFGLATMCIGVGQGIAMVVENVGAAR
ncbi:MAG: acetyl-CoA C-acyltransferase [Ilumatobacteraceae bacterium]